MDHALLFITPTYAEYAAVRAAVADRLAGGTLWLALCGIGPARALALSRRLERSGWTGTLALLGWAGGLSPHLAAGDLVVADAALDGGGQRVPLLPPDLPGATVGPLLSAPALLLTAQAKRDARSSGALAVEMEAYPLAAWAAARNLPFVHARIILDTASDALPDLGDALDVLGRVRPARLIRRLLGRPRTALSLLALARRVRELEPALQALARALAARGPQ